jgi:hypothetical protein
MMKLILLALSAFMITATVFAGVDHGNPSGHYKNPVFAYEFQYDAARFQVDSSSTDFVKLEDSQKSKSLTIRSKATKIQNVSGIPGQGIDITGCNLGALNGLAGYRCGDRDVLLSPGNAIFELRYTNDKDLKAVVSSFSMGLALATFEEKSPDAEAQALTDASPDAKFVLQGCGLVRLTYVADIKYRFCLGSGPRIFDIEAQTSRALNFGSVVSHTLSNDTLFFAPVPLYVDYKKDFQNVRSVVQTMDLKSGVVTDLINLPANSYCMTLSLNQDGLICSLNKFAPIDHHLLSAKLAMWDFQGKQIYESPELYNGDGKSLLFVPDLSFASSPQVLMIPALDLGGGYRTSQRSYAFHSGLKKMVFIDELDAYRYPDSRTLLGGRDDLGLYYITHLSHEDLPGPSISGLLTVNFQSGTVQKTDGSKLGIFDYDSSRHRLLRREDVGDGAIKITSWDPQTDTSVELVTTPPYTMDIRWIDKTQDLLYADQQRSLHFLNLQTGVTDDLYFGYQSGQVETSPAFAGMWFFDYKISYYISISQRKIFMDNLDPELVDLGFGPANLGSRIIGDGILLKWVRDKSSLPGNQKMTLLYQKLY